MRKVSRGSCEGMASTACVSFHTGELWPVFFFTTLPTFLIVKNSAVQFTTYEQLKKVCLNNS